MNTQKIDYWKFILLYTLLFSGCKVDQHVLDTKSKDVYVISVKDRKISVLYPTLEKGKIVIQTRGWVLPDDNSSTNFMRCIFLINQEDTMKLLFSGIQEYNYFLNNIEFKKGAFFVDVINPVEEIKLGKELDLPRATSKILFQNTLVRDRVNGYSSENLFLKEIKFIVIDFSNTVGVRLIPISDAEFDDPNFTPESLKRE